MFGHIPNIIITALVKIRLASLYCFIVIHCGHCFFLVNLHLSYLAIRFITTMLVHAGFFHCYPRSSWLRLIYLFSTSLCLLDKTFKQVENRRLPLKQNCCWRGSHPRINPQSTGIDLEAGVHRRQIQKTKIDPRPVRVAIFIMAVDP